MNIDLKNIFIFKSDLSCNYHENQFTPFSIPVFGRIDDSWNRTTGITTLAMAPHVEFLLSSCNASLVTYGSGKRMVTGTRTGSRMKTKNFKRRYRPHHKSQHCDIWCTSRPVISCFDPNAVDRSVPYEAQERRVKFRRSFGNIPLEESNVSVTNIKSSGNILPEPWVR